MLIIEKQKAALIATFVLCALLVLGTVLALAGLWPFQSLSGREPGVDRIVNLFRLGPLVITMWLAFAFSKPKGLAAAAAIVCTLWYCFSFVLFDVI